MILGKDLIIGKLYHISNNRNSGSISNRDDLQFYYEPYDENREDERPELHFFKRKAIVMFLRRHEVDNWIEYKVLLEDKIVYLGYSDNPYIVWKKLSD